MERAGSARFPYANDSSRPDEEALIGCVEKSGDPALSEPVAKAAFDFVSASRLRSFVEQGDVRLLRASTFARLAIEGELRDKHRQDLERYHPDAYADPKMVEKCLRETEHPSSLAFPGLVVVSYCWQTPRHPDPDGSLLKRFAEQLHWYAAQRGEDFALFMDFWSLLQPSPVTEPDASKRSRTATEQASFQRALRGMHVWYGHRGTMVLLLTETPPEWRHSREFLARGGYSARGWTLFEQSVSALGKEPGFCLDMGAWESVFDPSVYSRWEVRDVTTGGTCDARRLVEQDRRREKRLLLTGLFEKATRSELEAARMLQGEPPPLGDKLAWGSCLRPLIHGRQPAVLSPAAMDEQLRGRGFSDPRDGEACAEGYREVLLGLLGSHAVLSYHVPHWGWREWRSLGATLPYCERLEELDVSRSSMGSAGACAMASALAGGCIPQLARLSLAETAVGAVGVAALALSVRRGALSGLREVALPREDALSWALKRPFRPRYEVAVGWAAGRAAAVCPRGPEGRGRVHGPGGPGEVLVLGGARHGRSKHRVRALAACAAAVAGALAWVWWFAVPAYWIWFGRHWVAREWRRGACRVEEQSCVQRCSCACRGGAAAWCCPAEGGGGCRSAGDGAYFLASNCAWLASSLYEQLPNSTVRVRQDPPSPPAQPSSGARPGWLLAGLLAVTWSLGFVTVQQRRVCWWAVAVVGLGWWLESAFAAERPGCEGWRGCRVRWEVSVRVAVQGRGAAVAVQCFSPMELEYEWGEDSALCRSEMLQHRGEHCSSMEDVEGKPFCQPDVINRVGVQTECFVNPLNSAEVRLSGIRGIGKGSYVGFLVWSVVLVFFAVLYGAYSARVLLFRHTPQAENLARFQNVEGLTRARIHDMYSL